LTVSAVPKIDRKIFLHVSKRFPDVAQLFAITPFGDQWTEILYQSIDDVCRHFDLVLTSDSILKRPIPLPTNLSVAIWFSESNQLSKLDPFKINASIIFSPSAVAVLEARRHRRNTIVLTKNMKRGEVISSDHLTIKESDGSDTNGVSDSLLHTFLGLRAAYDLEAGKNLDFGHVL
jgi:hypothetical protein